ncbi:hypothetical protein OHV08_04915 [Streptomyces canus]|uniref:hypothetical protein n=1 Tax=Streptomyces canus TaxID=58343 RepID=UPI00324BBDD0
MVVEIHVPLLPTPDLPEVFDEGEEDGDVYVYVFVVTGAGEGDLLALASSMATLPGAPAGSVAVVSNDGAEEFGLGRRVARPLSAP